MGKTDDKGERRVTVAKATLNQARNSVDKWENL